MTCNLSAVGGAGAQELPMSGASFSLRSRRQPRCAAWPRVVAVHDPGRSGSIHRFQHVRQGSASAQHQLQRCRDADQRNSGHWSAESDRRRDRRRRSHRGRRFPGRGRPVGLLSAGACGRAGYESCDIGRACSSSVRRLSMPAIVFALAASSRNLHRDGIADLAPHGIEQCRRAFRYAVRTSRCPSRST